MATSKKTIRDWNLLFCFFRKIGLPPWGKIDKRLLKINTDELPQDYVKTINKLSLDSYELIRIHYAICARENVNKVIKIQPAQGKKVVNKLNVLKKHLKEYKAYATDDDGAIKDIVTELNKRIDKHIKWATKSKKGPKHSSKMLNNNSHLAVITYFVCQKNMEPNTAIYTLLDLLNKIDPSSQVGSVSFENAIYKEQERLLKHISALSQI